MTQTPCPVCGADIDIDSLFCDQCGAQLLICPRCGSFRKGKFCLKCGVPTIPAGEVAAPAQQPAPQPSADHVRSADAGMAAAHVASAGPRPTTIPPAVQQPVRITCRAMGITLMLQPGALIGRAAGPYAAQLAAFKYISGNHARIDFDGHRWTITDIGSRNGTTVNGMACRVSEPVGLRLGDVIRFATVYDFNVE